MAPAKGQITHLTDVLVFGTMGSISQHVCSSLQSHGLKTVSVPFAQNVFNDEHGYRRVLTQAIAIHRPQAVFPIGNPMAMSRFKALVEKGIPLDRIINSRKTSPETEDAVRSCIFAVESEEKLRLLDSKVKFYAMAHRLGLRQPGTYRSPDDIPVDSHVIFKRDISFGGHGVHQPRNIESLRNLISHQSPGEPYLIQEFIEGEDYSLDIVRKKATAPLEQGTLDAIAWEQPAPLAGEKTGNPVKYNDGFQYSGYKCLSSRGKGPAGSREVLIKGDPILEQMAEYAETIMEHLDYHGVCGFDFRMDNAGNVYMIECNPRFTGGIEAQLSAGFDIPWLLYKAVIS
ncbi:MAG: ATP-grasp domain-containing protein [Bacteroidales bacterium]|nr:ATP-grasp domain-containing protein [Bacteroidales bacterium]